MLRKAILTLTEWRSSYPGYNIFQLSIIAKAKGLLGLLFYRSGINFLNKESYFTKLVDAFKPKDKVMYWLFSISNTDPRNNRISRCITDDINKALALSVCHLLVYEEFHVELSNVNPSYLIYCLMIKDVQNIKQIFEYLFNSYTCHYVFFDSASNKDKIFSNVKDFKSLEEEEVERIVNLSSDVINFSIDCCSADEQFSIITNHFNKEQIKDRILNSVGLDKIKVIIK